MTTYPSLCFYWWGWKHAFPELSGQRPIPSARGGTIRRSFLAGGLTSGEFEDGTRFVSVGPVEIRWTRDLRCQRFSKRSPKTRCCRRRKHAANHHFREWDSGDIFHWRET